MLWGEFFGRTLGPLLKTGSSLMKNVLTSLPKSFLIPLGLTAVAAAAVAANLRILRDDINNFKRRNWWYYENSFISWKTLLSLVYW